MSVIEYYNPGYQRMDVANSSLLHLPVAPSHRWSPSVDSNPSISLSRSKSDMDMSIMTRTRSTSYSSHLTSPTRSETFPRAKEEKQGGMKSFISKGSKLLQKRRTSNRLKSMDWQNSDSSLHINKQSRGDKEQPEGLDFQCRPLISEPYNFRHLTHGGPAQARALQSIDRNQLVTEFSVIRASQAPRPELKGIKADDIVPQQSNVYSPPASRSPSPPSGYSNVLRSTKSVDCFTRVASNSFSSPYPPVTPPRRSSRRFQGGLGLNILESKVSNDAGPSSPVCSSSQDLVVPSQEIAQAVTTPDGSAQLLMTHQRTTSNLALADVPEEEEDVAKSVHQASKIRDLRHAKSFPARIVSYNDNEQSQMIDAQFAREDLSLQTTDPLSSELSQSDWEDDIDYCYEHALEAASFAWGDDDAWNLDNTSDHNPSTQNTSPYFQTTFSTTNNGSAASSSVSVPGIITPSDTTMNRDSFGTSHSLLFPTPSSFVSDQSDRTACNEPLQPGSTNISEIRPKTAGYTPSITSEYSPRNSGGLVSEFSSQNSLPTRKTSIAAAPQSSEHKYSKSGGSFPDMLPYGMTQRSKSVAASFHRSKSSENVIPKPLNLAPPHLPVAARSRSNSEAVTKFQDLSMIGAPSSGAAYRSRAGSVASVRPRTSYSIFPTTSMVVASR